MKKLIKGLLWTILGIIIILGILLAAHPLWIGAVVKTAATKVGPTYTGTPIELTDCDINLYAGRVAIGGFSLANPEGCSDPTAAQVGTFRIVVDPTTVTSDVIVIKDLEIADVYASYVKTPAGQYNFDAIAETASGGKKAPQAEAQPTETKPAETKPADDTKPTEEKKAAEPKSEKKVIIERLAISGVKVNYNGITIPCPPLTLTNIGKESNGSTLKDVWNTIYTQGSKALSAVGEQVTELGSKGVDAVMNASESVKDLGASATESVKDLGSSAADSVKDLGASATDGLKSAGESLKNLGSGAADSIKDAGMNLKSIFK